MTFINTPAPSTRSGSDLRIAYQQARSRYEADPANSQTIRALGWVYADLLKEASGSTDTTRMLRGMALIADFPMVEDARWRESVGWSVCRFLLRHKPETLSLGPLSDVLRRARPFVPAEPGLLRSVWWKALLRHTATGLDWLGLFDQYGWEGGFRPEDEQPETYGDGKTARPLVEGLVQAVAKQLLQGVLLPDELAAPWIDRLASLAAQHPDWDFLPYYQARLLIRLDRPTEAMAVFLPFARMKTNDFWVWSLLAELVSPEEVPACYARALTLGTPEAFLVNVRQRMAAWLILKNRWADARAEIDRLVQTRQVNQWPLPTQVQQWLNDSRYTQAEIVSLGGWYRGLLPLAERLLWADSPETVALVTGVDATGHYVNVSIDERTSGSFPANKYKLQPCVGDRLALRYTLQEKNGRMQLRVQTANATDALPTHLQTRTLSGPLRVVDGKRFGFVGDIYVPADLLMASVRLTDALVTVEAIASWDAVKQKSGWRAFRIQKESVNLSV
ncbi:DUF7017 domain-containing protein [Spirosoma areae]